MDVPSVDTSSLAAKRIEMDKVRHVGPKDQRSDGLRVVSRKDGQGEGSSSQRDEEDSQQETVETYDESAIADEHDGGHLFDALA